MYKNIKGRRETVIIVLYEHIINYLTQYYHPKINIMCSKVDKLD